LGEVTEETTKLEVDVGLSLRTEGLGEERDWGAFSWLVDRVGGGGSVREGRGGGALVKEGRKEGWEGVIVVGSGSL